MRKLITAVLCIAVFTSPAFAQAPKPEGEVDKPITVSFSAANEKVSSLIDRICKETGARILMEKTADVKVTASVNDIALEDALTAVCKAGELEWRKIYLRVDSPLLKKPDALAATVRLMAGLQFPDVLIERTSTQENLVHAAERRAVEAIPLSLRKDMGMVSVYVISNDKADKLAKEKAESRVEKYAELSREMMKLFMEMTPEEREQAMATGLQMVQQFDPRYMAEMTKSVLQNQQFMGQIMQSQMNMLFSMSPEDRRAILRMQMQAQTYMTPEQKQVLMEDAKAVMQELGIGQQPQ